MSAIYYQLELHNASAHIFRVHCNIELKQAQKIQFSLPDWIPGSYMIREFSKNIVRLDASLNGKKIVIEQLAKSQWQLNAKAGKLTISMDYYAFDHSVRSCFFDQNHAYFNGTSLFFRIQGFDARKHFLEILYPQTENYAQHWIVATAMRPQQINSAGFGHYQADNYEEFIDHPVEIAEQTRIEFYAKGIPHQVFLQGKHQVDEQRLAKDLQTLCEYELDLFGKPYPLDRYVFLVWIMEEGYGGLEHCYSTSLMVSRKDLPTKAMGKASEDYINFLALCAHEYFHCWNVKRLKPKAFIPLDLNKEVYTRLLWWFEGVTSYYDEWFLLRCGLIDLKGYLALIQKTWDRVLPYQGRKQQSLAQSSFNAWHKFYKQDENAQNAIVSYYSKGSMVAMALDLSLRQRSNNQLCLDDLLLYLWQHNGINHKGLEEYEVESVLKAVFKQDYDDFFSAFIYGTEEPDYEKLLATIGIQLSREAQDGNDLGAMVKNHQGQCQINRVFAQQAAMQAGLTANDILLAFDSVQVTYDNWQKLLDSYAEGEIIHIHAFRQGWLFECDLTVRKKTPKLTLKPMEKLDKQQQKTQKAWIASGKKTA